MIEVHRRTCEPAVLLSVNAALANPLPLEVLATSDLEELDRQTMKALHEGDAPLTTMAFHFGDRDDVAGGRVNGTICSGREASVLPSIRLQRYKLTQPK